MTQCLFSLGELFVPNEREPQDFASTEFSVSVCFSDDLYIRRLFITIEIRTYFISFVYMLQLYSSYLEVLNKRLDEREGNQNNQNNAFNCFYSLIFVLGIFPKHHLSRIIKKICRQAKMTL